MKKHRLIVEADTDDQPKGFDLREAFGCPLEYDQWVARTALEETPAAAGALYTGEAAVQAVRMRQLMVLMERPFFALGKHRVAPLNYLSSDGTIQVQITPGPVGMATIYDADLLMFLVSHLADSSAHNGTSVTLKGSDFLAALKVGTGGDQYALLAKSIRRLETTQVMTNARPDGKPGSVCHFTWIKKASREGKTWEISLPDWIAEGARSRHVLDVCAGYFDLGGFERRLYLIARKHVGRDPGSVFRIKILTLWAKSGSGSTLAKFRHELKSIVTRDQLPEYRLDFKENGSAGGLVLMTVKD
jgi:plasmid replication initiation protein